SNSTSPCYKRAGQLQVGDCVLARGMALTKFQRSMVIGSLLGDGGLSHSIERNSPQVVFTQGEAQLDYLMFKRSVLGQLAGKMCEGYSGYRPDHKVYQLPMKIVDELWPISAEMVVIGNRLWEPTDRFISWIDIQALAFWFADDGSISRNGGSGRPSANIHTSM